MIKRIAKKIKKLLGITADLSEFIIEPTFIAELNTKARQMILPAAILAMISWVPFLYIDIAIYPEKEILILLRLTVSVIGFSALIFSFIEVSRKYSYYILAAIMFSVSFLSGIILGIVKGDPVYMGGYSIVLLIIPFIPLKRTLSLSFLFSSILMFFIIGFKNEMVFSTSEYLYGLINIIFAFLASFLAIYFFDKDRKTSYGKSYLIQQTNEALENSNLEISSINKKIEKTALKLSISNDELKSVIEIKSEFLHIAAHDLKNPLQVILGYVEILSTEFNDNSKSQEKLVKIEKSVEQMIEIISKLLESEEIETEDYILNKRDIILNEILAATINKNMVQANNKQQIIKFISNHEIPFKGDHFILQQIFENLISNAIKFSPIGSEISIIIKENPESIVIAFQDEGPGLNEIDFVNLFKKFKRLSAKPTGNEVSSGVGLSIVKKYVEMHNGKVYAKNNNTIGSTFFVELSNV